MQKIVKYLLYILPAALYFSYWPVMKIGGNETMNFELSVPLLWLAIFDVVGLATMIKEKSLFLVFKKRRWMWLILPIFITISLIWSLNVTRGILTCGVMWAVAFAIYAMWNLRGWLDEKFWRIFWRWFFGAGIVVILWCVMQCILDVAGVGKEVTLLCAGCGSEMFGFPHPNGFAIEPQFMGNLLLAGAVLVSNQNGVFWGRGSSRPSSRGSDPSFLGSNLRMPHKTPFWLRLILLFIFTAGVFLTFSRGAIYAMMVALIFMTVCEIVRTKRVRALVIWPVVIVAFGVMLCFQGLCAAVGPTNDTFTTGISKSLNHLSLGIIDIKMTEQMEKTENSQTETKNEASENPTLENSAVFDGYVEESTTTRVFLTEAAIKVWQENPRNVLLGVGIGGAGQALYESGFTKTPKEIVQNEYASLLLEIGIIGISVVIFTTLLVIKLVLKNPLKITIFTLILAYWVSLCFFSGLTNALHIYLIPAILLIFGSAYAKIKVRQ